MSLSRIYIIIWMVLLGSLFLFSGCRNSSEDSDIPHFSPPVLFDLDSIKKRGKLILLTENGPSTYYQYRGQGKGFDYEMVKAFSKWLGVKLEVRVLDDVDRMFELLNKGEGDIIASNLTITPLRKRFALFSDTVYNTRQVLVQRKYATGKPDSTLRLVRDTAALEGYGIWVHRYSSFYSQLKSIEESAGIDIEIHEAPGEINTDDLIRLTADGEVNSTVTDENLAMIQQYDFPELDMSFAITGDEAIGWAMRANAPKLAEKVNEWLNKKEVVKKLGSTFNKYFTPEKQFGFRGPYVLPELSADKISPYDSLFKKYSKEINWDWRLLASLSYQESRFNPYAESWSGAFGLMQLMPETALRFGCDTNQREEPNIRAGVKYINHLQRFWKERIRDPQEQLKFILASYNIGPGHILDAQKIATHLGKADTIWDGHVAEALLLKMQERYYTLEGIKHGYCRATEPYHFVNKIMSVYQHYQTKFK